MSLQGRLTSDYSPLRPHFVDKRGHDPRPAKERRDYEAAVNARREMLELFATMEQPKHTNKQYRMLKNLATDGNQVAILKKDL